MILSIPTVSGSSMWSVLLILGGTVVMMMMLRRRGTRARLSGRELVDAQKERFIRRRDSHRAGDDLLVQLEELARRIGADVDTRYAKLEAVIRDADDRIKRLETLASRLGVAVEEAGPGEPAAVEGAGQAGGGGGCKPVPQDEGGDGGGPRKSPMADDPRFRAIYELIDGGATPIAAAEKLGLPLGEVELILDLRKMG